MNTFRFIKKTNVCSLIFSRIFALDERNFCPRDECKVTSCLQEEVQAFQHVRSCLPWSAPLPSSLVSLLLILISPSLQPELVLSSVPSFLLSPVLDLTTQFIVLFNLAHYYLLFKSAALVFLFSRMKSCFPYTSPPTGFTCVVSYYHVYHLTYYSKNLCLLFGLYLSRPFRILVPWWLKLS